MKLKLIPVIWVGSSLKDMKEMPEEVKKEFGHALREIQKGRDLENIKPLKHLGVTGILEIVVRVCLRIQFLSISGFF